MLKIKDLKKYKKLYIFYILIFGICFIALGSFLCLGISNSYILKLHATENLKFVTSFLSKNDIKLFFAILGLMLIIIGILTIYHYSQRIKYLKNYEMTTSNLTDLFKTIYPNRKYKVIKEFKDYNQNLHEVGDILDITKITWYPHDEIITLFADQKVFDEAIKLKWHKGYQNKVINFINEYLSETE